MPHATQRNYCFFHFGTDAAIKVVSGNGAGGGSNMNKIQERIQELFCIMADTENPVLYNSAKVEHDALVAALYSTSSDRRKKTT